MGKCTYVLAQPCGNSTGRTLEVPPLPVPTACARSPRSGELGQRGRARADGRARWEQTDCRVGGETPTSMQDQTTGRRQVKTPLGASCFLGLLGLRVRLAADTPAGRGGPVSPGT